MSWTLFMVCWCVMAVGGVVLIALFSGTDTEKQQYPGAFTVLPVPEDTPGMRSFLEFYASQVMWMDAAVLECVILVCTPESEALCRELAQNHGCYAVMSLPEVQSLLAERCSRKCGFLLDASRADP